MVTTRKIIKKRIELPKVGSAQNTKVNSHIKNKKSRNEKNPKIISDRTLKRTLKSSEKNNVQNKTKISSYTKAISEITESRKRKREDRISDEENTDCLHLSDLSKEHISQCISVINHLTEEQLKNNNALFDDESQSIFMQITCIRVPKTPRRCIRILLPYSIVSSNDEIALFVGDLQRGRRKDYEPTIEYYEDLLRKHNCTKIKAIIPMNQVKTEYDQYELKRKLVGSYDHFLVDGKIAGHLSHLLGREFYKKRKLPTSIRMHSKDLKHEIDYALRKTVMQIHSYGDTHIIQIGHTSMKKEEIIENILATCSYLSKNYPGGWANIRSIRIKTSSSLGLPIYTTLKNKCLVRVPIVQPKRPKAYRNVSGELSTAPGIVSVTVTPEGDVITVKKKRKVLSTKRN
ncbi:ribosomal L1 domain-containing protein 1 [Bombus flavifrons]|uniref:ribosomal L1 domain-containing protein 1 n=1 Tax=Bombus flavifrons TaxID=103934 RepID=UPI0037042FAF